MPQDDNETREQYLERLLAELVDAVVGANYHDLHGYGYAEADIDEIAAICRAHWDKRYPPNYSAI